jgi:4-diphosphocytidyl-2-C-methyl-D-erythritol kinase
MRYLAPAKLNLFLHITGRRADGYHELETVFQLIDLCDELTIASREDGRILRDPAPTDAMLASLRDDDDLTVRAARLLQRESGTAHGASIHVQKRIPAGGGLGGGSSDAATVLLALNEQWGLNWSRQRLAQLGLQLGSDVPVFVHGCTASARGRGEVLTPLELPERWYLVVHPGVAVSTAEIFSAADLTRDTESLGTRALPVGGGRNDCEPVVRARYPEVAAVLDRLAPCGGRLTGTGSCVFAPFDSQPEATAFAALLPQRWSMFPVRGMNRSP